jgi:hypothetical protein
MNTWAPLWNGLVDSSVWDEPDHVFRVFMAMMSLKDADHIVRYDGYKLAKRIHMTDRMDLLLDALKVLSEPDRLRPGQEFEGRRIEATEEGWRIINGEKYREMVQVERRRARNRKAQQAWRDRKKNKQTPLPGETAYVKGAENGTIDPQTAEPLNTHSPQSNLNASMKKTTPPPETTAEQPPDDEVPF